LVFAPTQASPSGRSQIRRRIPAALRPRPPAVVALYAARNAQSVQYVKICSLYGAGFYYIPGTDTCIKVGGFVRAEMNFNSNGSFAQLSNTNFDDRDDNRQSTRVRGGISVDAREQTQYGTLRSYFNMTFQVTNGGGGSSGAANPAVGQWLNRAFIQFAGFTAGLADSYFDFDTMGYSNQTNVLGSSVSGGGTDLFAYTAQFGNGFSATLSAEDTSLRRTALFDNSGGAGYAGERQWPDIVANLRLDQAWGSAQIMGAVHDVHASYYGAALPNSAPSDELGWAVGAGLKLNLPMIAKGDYIIAQVNYAEGAMDYVAAGARVGAGITIQDGGHGSPVTTGNGPLYDSTYDVVGGTGTDQDLTTGWSVTGGFEHRWNPQWRTSLYGAYAEFNYSDTSSARISGTAPGTTSADWAYWQVGSRTKWNPVKNLDLSVDVMYNHIDTAFDNVVGFEDKGWFAGMFRVQRNFYP
jgi:hypothetical protein